MRRRCAHLPDIEPVLFGRLELLGQHLHVVLAQADDGRVADDVHIGGRGIEEHGLLDGAQALARRLHRRLRLADGVQVLFLISEMALTKSLSAREAVIWPSSSLCLPLAKFGGDYRGQRELAGN